ncbi:MAG: CoA pyrophosphatase [Pseudomonadota bacterium]
MLDLDVIESCFKDTTQPAPEDTPLYPSPGPIPEAKRLEIEKDIKPAAVLVAFVERDTPTLMLTERTSHLRNHGGQVSFAGGRMEPGETPIETALREAEEEIGLTSDFVRVIGFMDKYMTGTGFSVYPIVARVTPGFELKLDAFEVAEAFEVPLSFALNKDNYKTISRTFGETRWHFYEAYYDDHRIWGATAGMLVGLADFIKNREI